MSVLGRGPLGIWGKRQKGLSLIEMLIAMVIAIVVIAGVYRTFAVQQKSFVVHEQVAAQDKVAESPARGSNGIPGKKPVLLLPVSIKDNYYK